jgi:hypothetical protein
VTPFAAMRLRKATASSDPYRANVVLHLRAGASAIEETTGKTQIVTATVSRSTARSAFGDQSILFDGVQGRIAFADSVDWYPSTRKFTLEGFAYADSSASGDRYLFGQATASGGFASVLGRRASSTLYKASISDGTTTKEATAGTFSPSTWVHFLLQQDLNNLYMAINGVLVATIDVTGITAMNSSGNFVVGAYADDAFASIKWFGNMDEIRYTQGVVRYPSFPFTPPSARFPTV